MRRTIVVGLGNPILTDDGVGIAVASEVESALTAERREDTHVFEAAVGGLRLAEMLDGYDRAVIVDALEFGSDVPTGTVQRMTLDDLSGMCSTKNTASGHDATFPTALATLSRIGLSIPEDIVIYAIKIPRTIDFGETMTPEVEQAIPVATTAILNEINRVRDQNRHAGALT